MKRLKRPRGGVLPPPIAEAVIGMAPKMTCVGIADALTERFGYVTDEHRVRQFLSDRGLKAKAAGWVPPSVMADERGGPGNLPLSRYPDYRGMTLTALLFGDPVPSRSALAQKMAEVRA